MKIRLALLDSNKVYVERFVGYMDKHYMNEFTIYTAENMQTLQEMPLDKVDVIVAEPRLWDFSFAIPKETGLLLYTESEDVEQQDGIPTIYKYLPIETMVSVIRQQYEKSHKKVVFREKQGGAKVLAFSGASGGAGTTTVAAACAIYLAMQGYRTLYLDLQTFGDSSLIFQGENTAGLSDVLFAAQNEMKNLGVQLEHLMSSDKSGVWFFKPFSPAADANGWKDKDLQAILQALASSDRIQYLVIDTDGADLRKNQWIYDVSDQIVWVCAQNDMAIHKLERALSAWEVLDDVQQSNVLTKSSVVWNFCNSKSTGSKVFHGISPVAQIPQLRGTTEQIARTISYSDIFHEMTR